jgi:hypothetical protein
VVVRAVPDPLEAPLSRRVLATLGALVAALSGLALLAPTAEADSAPTTQTSISIVDANWYNFASLQAYTQTVTDGTTATTVDRSLLGIGYGAICWPTGTDQSAPDLPPGALSINSDLKTATLDAVYDCSDGRTVHVALTWTGSEHRSSGGTGTHTQIDFFVGAFNFDYRQAVVSGSIDDGTSDLIAGRPADDADIGRLSQILRCGYGQVPCPY